MTGCVNNFFSPETLLSDSILRSGPDPDDELDSGVTDSIGRFTLSGSTHEMTTIDPHLKVYHDCNDGLIVRKIYRVTL